MASLSDIVDTYRSYRRGKQNQEEWIERVNLRPELPPNEKPYALPDDTGFRSIAYDMGRVIASFAHYGTWRIARGATKYRINEIVKKARTLKGPLAEQLPVELKKMIRSAQVRAMARVIPYSALSTEAIPDTVPHADAGDDAGQDADSGRPGSILNLS